MQESPTPSAFPADFDHALDMRIDALARNVGLEMQVQPDIARWEYSALVWRNATGVFRTTVERGLETKAPLDKLWPQVGWSSGGKIVAIVHSHPSDQKTGSVAKPVWIPLPNPFLPSSEDFDQLLRYSGKRPEYDAEKAGFDTKNYRSYIITRGLMAKYHAFDQPPGSYKRGGQAIWAVRATGF